MCTMFAHMTSSFSGQVLPAKISPVLKAKTRCRSIGQHVKAAVQEPPASMKELRKPRAENVNAQNGFFVDHTCIDCDTCRWMAPDFFKRKNSQSAVLHQPKTEVERFQAFQALLSCPTYSIHGPPDLKAEQRAAEKGLPRVIPGTDNCYLCGFTDFERSYGCASYLIRRPEGNVLVDVPRFVPKLVDRIKELGGVKYMFLTHKDDIASHEKWASALGAERIMHEVETRPEDNTDVVEHMLTGEGPWSLPDGKSDCQIIFTPGHTPAHCCFLFKPDKTLFTGDHLAAHVTGEWTEMHETADNGFLGMTRNFNWWRVDKQVDSCVLLAEYDWHIVLPGHGRPGRVKDAADRRQQLQLLKKREIERGFERLPGDHTMRRFGKDF